MNVKVRQKHGRKAFALFFSNVAMLDKGRLTDYKYTSTICEPGN
ncbi:hypothetical protein [Robinsoniella peoriensis]